MSQENIKDKVNEFFEYVAKFGKQHPEISQGYMTLMGSVMKEGKLGTKEKELIALGIAVGVRCVPCIHAHTQGALHMGATKEEVLEAASVAVVMGGGPGLAHVIEVMKALEAFTQE